MAQDGRPTWNSTPPDLDVDAFARVATTFINFCAAFNKQESAILEDLLTENAILYRIKSGTPIIGKTKVMEYFEEKFKTEKPICAPITTTLHPPSLPTSVRGVALWGSGNSPSDTFSIQYEILFQHHAPYKITSMWARPG